MSIIQLCLIISQDFECASQRGTCLAVEVEPGNYRYLLFIEFCRKFFANLQSNVSLYK